MVLEQIRDSLATLSAAKQRVGAYILRDWQEVAFYSVSQLARGADVSESVVVRFANDMGYAGYPDLQDEIRTLVRQKLGLVDRYQRAAKDQIGETDKVLDRVMTNDVNNIQRTLEQLEPAAVDRAVDLITGARKVILLANRSSAGPAMVACQYLNSILGNASFPANAYENLFDELRLVGSEDVVIAISFAWYTRQTVAALEYCRERGAKAIALTDSPVSPLVPLSDVTLLARTEGVSFYVSQVATLSLVNALLFLVAARTKDASIDSLRQMEELYSRFYTPPDHNKIRKQPREGK